MEIVQRITEAYRAANEAYEKVLAPHGRDQAEAPQVVRCLCGWTPDPEAWNKSQLLDLHLSAVEESADQAWYAAYDATMKERG